MQVLVDEQQKQAKHEAELRRFKQLAAIKAVPACTSPTNNGVQGTSSPVPRFLGQSVLLQGSDGLISQPQKQLPTLSESPSVDNPVQKGTAKLDANEAATMRARARKIRQQRHNATLGIRATDQAETSEMFVTALYDAVKEDAVLLCDDSPYDRRQFDARKHASRNFREKVLGTVENKSPTNLSQNATQSSQNLPVLSPQTNRASPGEDKRVHLLSAANIKRHNLGQPSDRSGARIEKSSLQPASRDYALLNVLHEQTLLLEKQVGLETNGGWTAAEVERQRRENLLKANDNTPNLPKLSVTDEDALLQKLTNTYGTNLPPNQIEIKPVYDTRSRRQRILQYMEDNKNVQLGARSALEKMYQNVSSPYNNGSPGKHLSPHDVLPHPANRSSSAMTINNGVESNVSDIRSQSAFQLDAKEINPKRSKIKNGIRSIPKGYHQPSSLFPHAGSMVYSGPKKSAM